MLPKNHAQLPETREHHLLSTLASFSMCLDTNMVGCNTFMLYCEQRLLMLLPLQGEDNNDTEKGGNYCLRV